MFLNRKLNFDPSISTAIYHTNELLAYSFSIIGAIIAESWWGLYNTVSWMSIVGASGFVILTVASIETINLPMV